MSCILSSIVKNVSNIEVLDYTPPEPEYEYLRPRGTIIVEIDKKMKVLFIHLDFDRWSQILFASSLKTICSKNSF